MSIEVFLWDDWASTILRGGQFDRGIVNRGRHDQFMDHLSIWVDAISAAICASQSTAHGVVTHSKPHSSTISLSSRQLEQRDRACWPCKPSLPVPPPSYLLLHCL